MICQSFCTRCIRGLSLPWVRSRLTGPFFSALLSIVIIDLILAGDNAVVIAMAVRSLPQEQRRKGIIYGSAAAVAAAGLRHLLRRPRLLAVSYVKLVGGMRHPLDRGQALRRGREAEVEHRTEAARLWHAVRLIVIADITMALDNMLAVGGASHGNFFLLLFGLMLSIPFIVFTSSLLSLLMDKYPFIIYVGAAILGKVGGEMIMTDPVVAGVISPGKPVLYLVEVLFASGVLVAGHFRVRRDLARERSSAASGDAS